MVFDNVSPPNDEFKNRVQELAIDILDTRFRIDSGQLKLVFTYKNKLNTLYMAVFSFLSKEEEEELEKIKKEIQKGSGIDTVQNVFSGEYSMVVTKPTEYHKYIETTDKYQKFLFNILKKNNLLVKTMERNRPLT